MRTNKILRRLRRTASAGVTDVVIKEGAYNSVVLKFKCDTKDSSEAASEITNYFMTSGIGDATKFIEIVRNILFYEVFGSDDSSISTSGWFRDSSNLTVEKLQSGIPASQIADNVTREFYDDVFEGGSALALDGDTWTLMN